jgi:predicted RNA methylase
MIVLEDDISLPPILNPRDLPKQIRKYFKNRSTIFNRYDQGIRVDQVGLYSATPEAMACYIAERCCCSKMMDLFAGCGGNTIQFSKTCDKVIAVDNNKVRLSCCKHNAGVYDCKDNIKYILSDVVEYLEHMISKGEVVDGIFMSPPWGGPDYVKELDFDFSMMPIDWDRVIKLSLIVSKNLALFLPRSLSDEALKSIGKMGRLVQIEEVYSHNYPRGILVYTNDFVDK